MYHYAGNNPVKYTDPDGRWIQFVIGAVAGGAISGGLAASGVGLGGQVLVNGAISTAQDAITQFVFEDKNLSDADYMQLGLSFFTGCLAGRLGGKGADSSHTMASSTKQLFHRIGNAFTHKRGNDLISELGKAIAYYGKTNGLKSISKETVVAILKGTIPSAVNLGAEIYKKVEQIMKGDDNNE